MAKFAVLSKIRFWIKIGNILGFQNLFSAKNQNIFKIQIWKWTKIKNDLPLRVKMPFLAFRSSTFRYLLIDQTAKAAQMSAMYCVYKYSASCTTHRKVGPFWSPFFSKSSLGSHLPRYLLLANKSYHSKDLDLPDQQQNF